MHPVSHSAQSAPVAKCYDAEQNKSVLPDRHHFCRTENECLLA